MRSLRERLLPLLLACPEPRLRYGRQMIGSTDSTLYCLTTLTAVPIRLLSHDSPAEPACAAPALPPENRSTEV